MNAHEEKMFDAKVDRHFKSHRELPKGRNFLCWNRDRDSVADQKYRDNYDQVFRNSRKVVNSSTGR